LRYKNVCAYPPPTHLATRRISGRQSAPRTETAQRLPRLGAEPIAA